MFKKFIIVLTFLFVCSPLYAHSGRLDNNGGHNVNKEWTYNGRYIVVKNKIKYYQTGEILFKKGDYHFHCKPSRNGFIDGIYLPVKDIQEVIE